MKIGAFFMLITLPKFFITIQAACSVPTLFIILLAFVGVTASFFTLRVNPNAAVVRLANSRSLAIVGT